MEIWSQRVMVYSPKNGGDFGTIDDGDLGSSFTEIWQRFVHKPGQKRRHRFGPQIQGYLAQNDMVYSPKCGGKFGSNAMGM